MQLKGLIRFFTILLIVYSLYQLSFTWFVKNHESKMEAKAKAYVKKNFPSALDKYSNNKDSQAIYQEKLEKVFQDRLRKLLDSTREETLTYGINGAVSYQKAKEEELNLGLDLQGGMNVTLEVEMTGLLRSLANNSKDPNFNKAISNAEGRKANSGSDFITLFIQEYRKLEATRPMASLFAGAAGNKIDITSTDLKVESYIREEARGAFDRTFRVLRTRIDQFGVAQPNINPNREKGIINVELPGVKDKDRVRKLLQSTAVLEFWEVYTFSDAPFSQGWTKTDAAFTAKNGGAVDPSSLKSDTTKTGDTTGIARGDTTGKGDTNLLSKKINTTDTINKTTATRKITLQNYIQFASPYQDEKGNSIFGPSVGAVGVKDTADVSQILKDYAGNFPSDVKWAFGIAPKDKTGKPIAAVPLYGLRSYGRSTAELDGDAISDASMDYDQSGKVEVRMNMKSYGASIWKKITEKAAGDPMTQADNRCIAIVLDNIVYSAPTVINAIPNGTSSISGSYTTEEATDLANVLKAGKLPTPAKIVADQQVGPTLGKQAIQGGTMAFVISFIVIFLLMLVYYNTSGWIANIALILNLLFTIGILAGLGATLTAPGIAGLVLTIGMAVDTNVIIYERIKEELDKGKGYIPAINEGYKRSLPPVLDAHVTTLLTAIILFYFGLGPVKGFATTQIIGILLSLFCGILVSRWVSDLVTTKQKHLKYFTGISRSIFKQAKFKFIEYRKVAYVISMIVLALGIASYFNGFDQGVEFKGGRSFNIKFEKPVDVEKSREDLRIAFEGESPLIKTIGDNATLDITTSYQINNPSLSADSIVESKLLAGLKNYLPAGTDYNKFNTEYKQGSNKVLPTISDDLKVGAIKATIFAILVIFLYIFVRFRDWRYSMGTIVALLHDVLVTLAVFSFARNIVPFPLEIDQHFIAAVLTVIGFSMNDTVIVFDRIREDTRLMPNAPKTEVINRAINETLSRTVMTSLTVFITLLILFIVGGEVTRGFAFAMLIGVITGTYSSIFVAAPILVDLGGNRGLGQKAAPAAKMTGTLAVKAKA